MSASRITVLGAGSVRCSVPVIASLATYYGERPIEIRFVDADSERLDLFDRLARVCFLAANSSHQLISGVDFREALESPDRVILQIGANCARKYLRASRPRGIAELDDSSMIEQAVESLVAMIPSQSEVLSLMAPEIFVPKATYHRLDWPGAMPIEDRPAVPHQVLRWTRGELGVRELLRKYEESPLKTWLDDPTSATVVQSASHWP